MTQQNAISVVPHFRFSRGPNPGDFRKSLESVERSSSVRACLLTVILVGTGAGIASAQQPILDRVVLQPKRTSSRITLNGTVIDYTGEKITVRMRQSSLIRSYPAAEVVEVRTPQTEHHVKGLAYFAQGDLQQAVRSFETALKEEPRAWVRRDILALLVRCALRQDDYTTAGSRFVSLWSSDLKTRHFLVIPLSWATRDLGGPLKTEAIAWMHSSDEVPKLLGASHLLADLRYGDAAAGVLKLLATSTDRRVQQLARAQLWRLRVLEGNVTRDELHRWRSRIEAMPQPIRGGPYFVLGHGHLRRQEYDRAALALLWLPFIYDDDAQLAARACLEAADALSRIGQKTEAITLYREVRTRFRETIYAQEAKTVLDSLLDEPGRKPSRQQAGMPN